MAWYIGISKFIKAMFSGVDPRYVQSTVFDILDMLEDQTPQIIYKSTHEKRPIPAIMCNWLAGIEKGQDMVYKAKKQIDKLYKNNYFKSYSEKDVVEQSICSMFNPCKFAKSIKPIGEASKILEEISKDFKKSKNQMFILSNWDRESFDQVYNSKKCKEIFKYFDLKNIMISGNTGFIKPNPDIFLLFLKRYGINPKDCIFIDDQKANLLAAEKFGMLTIQANGNFNGIREKLKNLGVLQ